MGWPTDFAGWKTRIRDWLVAYDLPDMMFGHCLDAANERLNRELNSQWAEKTFPYTIVDGNPLDLAALIPDYSRMRLVNVTGGPALQAMALNEYINFVSADPSGDPAVYCVSNMQLLIAPAVPVGSEIQIHYYAMQPALSDTVEQNVFSTKHPDALLYAALLEASPMIGEDERIEAWNSYYVGVVKGVNIARDRANLGSTPLKRTLKVM